MHYWQGKEFKRQLTEANRLLYESGFTCVEPFGPYGLLLGDAMVSLPANRAGRAFNQFVTRGTEILRAAGGQHSEKIAAIWRAEIWVDVPEKYRRAWIVYTVGDTRWGTACRLCGARDNSKAPWLRLITDRIAGKDRQVPRRKVGESTIIALIRVNPILTAEEIGAQLRTPVEQVACLLERERQRILNLRPAGPRKIISYASKHPELTAAELALQLNVSEEKVIDVLEHERKKQAFPGIVRAIRQDTRPVRVIAAEYRMGKQTIRNIQRRVSWADIE